MRTLLPDPPPVPFERLLAERRRTGADLHDEVWEGVYRIMPTASGRHGDVQQQLAELLGPLARARGLHPMIAEFNLGERDDYRVPDGGLHRAWRDRVYYPGAALVLEIVSPDDDTWRKLDFYAAHGVDELLIVDPAERSVRWLALAEGEYRDVQGRSALLDLDARTLRARITWPLAAGD
jgi:Uma2 family endonuclease